MCTLIPFFGSTYIVPIEGPESTVRPIEPGTRLFIATANMMEKRRYI